MKIRANHEWHELANDTNCISITQETLIRKRERFVREQDRSNRKIHMRR